MNLWPVVDSLHRAQTVQKHPTTNTCQIIHSDRYVLMNGPMFSRQLQLHTVIGLSQIQSISLRLQIFVKLCVDYIFFKSHSLDLRGGVTKCLAYNLVYKLPLWFNHGIEKKAVVDSCLSQSPTAARAYFEDNGNENVQKTNTWMNCLKRLENSQYWMC